MKISKSKAPIYTIQENGLISDPNWAEGRLIPAVVLNSSMDNNLKELLKVHIASGGQGDVIVQWGSSLSQFFKPKSWVLLITFTKPMEFSFIIEFTLAKHSSIIDAIIQSRGLHILYGFAGDKISKRTSEDMVLIEVPDTNQDSKWNATLKDVIKYKLKKQNISKKELNNEVEKQIREMREILHFRAK